jgi:hypothetical protein
MPPAMENLIPGVRLVPVAPLLGGIGEKDSLTAPRSPPLGARPQWGLAYWYKRTEMLHGTHSDLDWLPSCTQWVFTMAGSA